VPGGGLTSAKATYESVYGLIVSEWVKENGRMSVNITIPVNTQAMVVLPGAIVSQVMECGIPLSQKQGIATPKQTGTDAQVAIGSGVYHFEYSIA
jgi:alpha-L-rhamnosidase